MIGKKQVEWAISGHIQLMQEPDKAFHWLEINKQAFGQALGLLTKVRKPKTMPNKRSAYQVGFTDGFIIGVEAAYDVLAQQCGRCGTWLPRAPDEEAMKARVRESIAEKVKEDFDVENLDDVQMEFVAMCTQCIHDTVAEQAARNN